MKTGEETAPVAAVLQLAAKEISYSEPLQELPFTLKTHSSFGKELVKTRCIPLLQMKILFELGLEEQEYIVGFTSCTEELWEAINDDESRLVEKKEQGPVLVEGRFTGLNMFERHANNLGVSYMLIRYAPYLEGMQLQNKDGTLPIIEEREFEDETGWQRSFGSLVIIGKTTKIILTNDKVLVPQDDTELKEKISNIITYHIDKLQTFLEKYENAATIPHSIYIDWLQQWYPGRIHFKFLEK